MIGWCNGWGKKQDGSGIIQGDGDGGTRVQTSSGRGPPGPSRVLAKSSFCRDQRPNREKGGASRDTTPGKIPSPRVPRRKARRPGGGGDVAATRSMERRRQLSIRKNRMRSSRKNSQKPWRRGSRSFVVEGRRALGGSAEKKGGTS